MQWTITGLWDGQLVVVSLSLIIQRQKRSIANAFAHHTDCFVHRRIFNVNNQNEMVNATSSISHARTRAGNRYMAESFAFVGCVHVWRRSVYLEKNTKLNGTNLMPFFVSHDNSHQTMNGRMEQFRYEIRADRRTCECLAGSCWMWDNDFIRAVGLRRRVFHRMEIELKLIGRERHHVYIVHHSTTLHVRQQPWMKETHFWSTSTSHSCDRRSIVQLDVRTCTWSWTL